MLCCAISMWLLDDAQCLWAQGSAFCFKCSFSLFLIVGSCPPWSLARRSVLQRGPDCTIPCHFGQSSCPGTLTLTLSTHKQTLNDENAQSFKQSGTVSLGNLFGLFYCGFACWLVFFLENNNWEKACTCSVWTIFQIQ